MESLFYADGEIVGLVLSVTSHTRRVVFLIVFSLQPLTEQLCNKRSKSLSEQLLFGPTQNIRVIQGI